MLKLFSRRRPLPTMRPELRDVASSAARAEPSAATGALAAAGAGPASPGREPAGVYVMVDNFS
jgi:hypothetical protein